jgi:hypothetical protein
MTAHHTERVIPGGLGLIHGTAAFLGKELAAGVGAAAYTLVFTSTDRPPGRERPLTR